MFIYLFIVNGFPRAVPLGETLTYTTYVNSHLGKKPIAFDIQKKPAVW